MGHEKMSPTPEEQAELEKSRTIHDAYLLQKGAAYEIKDGKKRLHATNEQKKELAREVERELEGRYGSDRELYFEDKEVMNKGLEVVGLESIKGLRSYDLNNSLGKSGGEGWLHDKHKIICCSLGEAMGDYEESCSQKFRDPAEIDLILRYLYQYRPDLNDLERPFVLTGDFGAVVIKGHKLGFLQH